MNYHLVKSEPFKYSWDQFVKDGHAVWDGVRNHQARNNLQAMKKGDKVLYYHSNEGKEIVGIAKVTKTAYQDPTTDNPAWVVVDLEPVKPFKRAVTLAEMKGIPQLKDMGLLRQSRLSVCPISKEEYAFLVKMGSEG